MRKRTIWLGILSAMFFVALGGSLSAEEKKVQKPEEKTTTEEPEMEVPSQGLFGESCFRAKRVYKEPENKRQQKSPSIDGKLDDECWQKGWSKSIDSGAVVIENFHALNSPLRPVAKTKAYVCYDDEALYIAWECYDKGLDTGETVHTLDYMDSSVKTKISSIPDQKHGPYPWDRRVHVSLDTVGDKNSDNFYNFFANPTGLAYTTRSMGIEWNGVYELKTSLGKNVWYAEMRIPYSSLSLFSKTPEFWRIDFERIMPGYIVWGGTSECTLDPGLMQPLGLSKMNFSEYCYQVEISEPERYFLGKNTIKAKVRNTSAKETKLLARLLLTSPEKEKVLSETLPLELKGNEEKEISFTYDTKGRGEYELIVQLNDAGTNKLLCSSERYFITVPELIECALVEPHYQATIYASDPIEKIVIDGTVTPDDMKDLKGLAVSAELFGEGGKKIKEEKIKLSDAGKFEFAFPAKGMADGKYYVSIKLNNSNKMLCEKKIEFRKVPPAANEVVIDKNGNLLLNGKLFYPIAPFGGGTAEAVRDFGFNSTGWARSKKELDALQAAGLKGFYHIFVHSKEKDYISKYVNELKDHPALLGWYVWDEPSGCGVIPDKPRGNAMSLKEQYEMIHQLDPYHPIIITDYTPDVYKIYEPVCDIINPDIYPIHSVRNVPLEWVANCLDRAEESVKDAKKSGRGQKTMCFTPQAFGGPGGDWGRWALPNAEEMRCQTYLGVVHGMKGVFYYIWQPAAQEGTPCWNEIKKMGPELKELAPVLANPDSKLKVNASPAQEIHTLLKEYEGSYYLIAVNAGKMEKAVSLSIPVPSGFDDFIVSLPYEKERSVEMKKGKFIDTFPAYGVHIYKMELK